MMAHEGIGKFRVGYQSIKTDTTRALLGKNYTDSVRAVTSV